MASSKTYLEFVLEQLSMLSGINYRPMMGEYLIYFREKIIGGIYDDRFLIKPTASAIEYIGNVVYELPYEGAKKMILVENLEDKEFLKTLVLKVYDDLLPQKAVKEQK